MERREMARPTKMTSDWKIQSTENPKAPITLVGLVIQKGPLHMRKILLRVLVYSLLSAGFLR